MIIYKNYDQAALDAQYNLRRRHPNFQDYFDKNEQKSERVRQALSCQLDIAYGNRPGERLDVFPAPELNAPVHLFIHGGYWQFLDKRSHDFVAEPFVAIGCTTVVINYDLAPSVGIDEIVRQVRAALAWTYQNINTFNGDPSQIYISGHSAGGHLVAMAMVTDWEKDWNLPANLVKGGCA
ncbi:MAG: alpha/beta hydrolase, partial [Nitrospira sp.]|nr:alpha/beta hydrolase [Nitrospira sp.]